MTAVSTPNTATLLMLAQAITEKPPAMMSEVEAMATPVVRRVRSSRVTRIALWLVFVFHVAMAGLVIRFSVLGG